MLIRLSRPDGVAVDLETAKTALRVDHDDDDLRIAALIASETLRYEDFTQRVIVPTEFEAQFAGWCEPLVLPIGPVRSISAVVYLDEDHAEQTVDAADWYRAEGSTGAEIRFADSFDSPTLSDRPNPVRVRFVAGAYLSASEASESDELLIEPRDQTNIIMLVQRIYDTGEQLTDDDLRRMMGHRRVFR